MTKTAELVTLTIDGQALEVAPGTLIIRAAEQLGITIPRFCDHRLLAPVAACRQCLVEVEGQRKPVASCAQAVAEGMVVKTQLTSEMAAKAQESNLEFLLINHPLDCPMCDKGGECPLQDQTLWGGRGESRFVETKRHFAKPIKISETVLLDRDRCVQCARCTRFASDIAGDPFIELFERGALEQVAIFADEGFESYYSGNVVQICPVGALTSPSYRFQARPFDLAGTDGICNHCASGCNLRVDARRGLVTRRLARDNDDVNEAWSCDRGRYGFVAEQSANRLLVPVARGDDGELAEVGWRDALHRATDGLRRAGSSVGVIVGGHLTDQDAYALQKLARSALGTNNVDARTWDASPTEIQVLSRVAGSDPGPVYADIERAGAVVVVDLDPHEESPILHLRLRKSALTRGVPVVGVGPRAGRLAEFATIVPTLPGEEPHALAAIARGEGPAGELIGGAKGNIVVLAGWRAGTSEALVAAATFAKAVGGSFAWVPRRAGDRGALDAGAHPELLPGGRRVVDGAAREELGARWGAALPPEPGLSTRAMLEAAADGRLGALVLAGVDLVRDVGSRELAERALTRAFVVAIDLEVNDTTGLADVVLPAVVHAETRGTYTDWEGRVQEQRPAVPVRGVALGVWELGAQLARRLGADLGLTTYDQVAAEVAELRRRVASTAAPEERQAPAAPGEVAPAAEGDPTTERRRSRSAKAAAASTAAATASVPEPAGDERVVLVTYPLLLDGASLLAGADDLARETRPAFVEVHPGDASRLGLRDGGRAIADFGGNRAARLPVRVSPGVAPGCAFVPATQPDLSLGALLGAPGGCRVLLTPDGAGAP